MGEIGVDDLNPKDAAAMIKNWIYGLRRWPYKMGRNLSLKYINRFKKQSSNEKVRD